MGIRDYVLVAYLISEEEEYVLPLGASITSVGEPIFEPIFEPMVEPMFESMIESMVVDDGQTREWGGMSF